MAARGMGQHSYNLAENPLIMLCLLKMSFKGSVCDDANFLATAELCGDWTGDHSPPRCARPLVSPRIRIYLCWGTFSDILIAPRGLRLRIFFFTSHLPACHPQSASGLQSPAHSVLYLIRGWIKRDLPTPVTRRPIVLLMVAAGARD